MKWNDIITDEEFYAHWKLVEETCKKNLQVIRQSKHLFYRGMKYNQPYCILTPRTDRQPRDSNKLNHDLVNYGFKLMVYETNRSNSLAITQLMDQANIYGNPYIVIPNDNCVFMSSSEEDMGHMIGLVIDNLYFYLVTNAPGIMNDTDQLRNRISFLKGQNSLVTMNFTKLIDKLNFIPDLENVLISFFKQFFTNFGIKESKDLSELNTMGEVIVSTGHLFCFDYYKTHYIIEQILWGDE